MRTKPHVVTVRLDQTTRDRIVQRVPENYRTVSALVRAGIDEVLAKKDPATNGWRVER
jgi:hypothetical protein